MDRNWYGQSENSHSLNFPRFVSYNVSKGEEFVNDFPLCSLVSKKVKIHCQKVKKMALSVKMLVKMALLTAVLTSRLLCRLNPSYRLKLKIIFATLGCLHQMPEATNFQ